MILNFYGGIAPPGSYTTVIAHGQTAIGHGVRCNTLIVNGTAELNGCGIKHLVFQGGLAHCMGNLDCHCVTGHGKLIVAGALTCSCVNDFTGMLKAETITCTADLLARGTLNTTSLAVGEASTFTGRIIAHSATAKDFTLSVLKATMLTRCGMEDYARHSKITTIKASNVRIQATTAESIEADAVLLDKKSYAQQVLYNTSLNYDSTSNVSVIRHRHRKLGTPHQHPPSRHHHQEPQRYNDEQTDYLRREA